MRLWSLNLLREPKRKGCLVDMEQLDLSMFFTTKAQATDFNTRLANVISQIYQTGFDLEKTLMEQFGIEKKEKFITLLRDNKVNTDSASVLKEFLEKMQEKTSSLPVLTLTIAFEPTDQSLRSFSEWLLLNNNKHILLDIEVEKNLVAGASITYNGKYANYSIFPKFEKALKEAVSNTQSTRSVQETPSAPENNRQSIQYTTVAKQ
jgi:F0F1-type ATP synthase delta subunit